MLHRRKAAAGVLRAAWVNDDLMAFIGSGLQKAEHINTELWENNPLKDTHPSWIDAYSFITGTKTGYIAYCPNPKMKNWRLKSFKQNIVGNQEPIGSLSDAFAKAGLLADGTKEKK